jgi:hypothetical protein
MFVSVVILTCNPICRSYGIVFTREQLRYSSFGVHNAKGFQVIIRVGVL